MELSSLVPGAVALCVNVLSNPANRWGVTFLFASLTASFAVLRPRHRRREARFKDAATKAEPLLPHQLLSHEDLEYVEKARRLMRTIPPPIHSGFLVAACISYVDEDGEVRYVLGVNSETCVLPSAICAERCALLQMRVRSPRYRAIRGVYITTSAADGTLITPGLLCREMMQEYAADPASVRVVLFSQDWRPDPVDETGRSGACSSRRALSGRAHVHRLSDLYPFPSIYHRVPREAVVEWGTAFAARAEPVSPSCLDVSGLQPAPGSPLAAQALALGPLSSPSSWQSFGVDDAATGISAAEDDEAIVAAPAAVRAVLEAAVVELHGLVLQAAQATGEASEALYPIRFAAGALFADGQVHVSRQDPGQEYGCTADAAVKLALSVAGAAAAGAPALVVLQVDQFGVCHALHAQARSWFTENGHGGVVTFIHRQGDGSLVRAPLASLAPLLPAFERLLPGGQPPLGKCC